MVKKEVILYEEIWTGKNKTDIEKFFNRIGYTKFSYVYDEDKILLYDENSLIEINTILFGILGFGIIKKITRKL